MVWPQIPKLLALPSPRDLARSNLALAQTNASLETTIAWRTHELELAKQRFEQALSRSNITVFHPGHRPSVSPGSTIRGLGRTVADLSAAPPPRISASLDAEEEPSAEAARSRERPDGHRHGRRCDQSEGTLYLDMTVSPTLDHGGRDRRRALHRGRRDREAPLRGAPRRDGGAARRRLRNASNWRSTTPASPSSSRTPTCATPTSTTRRPAPSRRTFSAAPTPRSSRSAELRRIVPPKATGARGRRPREAVRSRSRWPVRSASST